MHAYMCVCMLVMYVCSVYICMYICIYIYCIWLILSNEGAGLSPEVISCMYVCVYVCLQAFSCIHIYARARTHMSYACTFMRVMRTCACTYAHGHTCTHTYIHIHAYMFPQAIRMLKANPSWKRVAVPMPGDMESLNVAVAAAILLYALR